MPTDEHMSIEVSSNRKRAMLLGALVPQKDHILVRQ
jgi:hypothetical protein